MDGAREYYVSEISQSEKDKYHMISFICGIEETKQMNMGTGENRKTKKQTLNYREQPDGSQRGGGLGAG